MYVYSLAHMPENVKRVPMSKCPKCIGGKMVKEADGDLVCISCGLRIYPRKDAK